MNTAVFPSTRLRRTRQNSWTRSMVQENNLSVSDLIWPIFVIEGNNTKETVASMPGVERLTIDLAVKAAKYAKDIGIPALALFPNTPQNLRSEKAEEALNPDNLICKAVREIKNEVPDIGLICDTALDPYTTHGHDGILYKEQINNDMTIEVLIAQSLNQVKAGCDIIAPSDMMDGRVGAIRNALENQGHENTLIMSYTAKYASAFYGPFRDAVGANGNLKGDKKTYQMDPANTHEAIREAQLDIAEGADMIMIKPGMPYLDILSKLKQKFLLPTFVYQVSGEYAMLMAAFEQEWLDADRCILESLIAFKRAGADGIFTYFAPKAAELLHR